MEQAYLGAFFLHVLHDVFVLFIVGQLLHRDCFLQSHNVGGSRKDGWGNGWGIHVGHVYVWLGLCSCVHIQQSLFLTEWLDKMARQSRQ